MNMESLNREQIKASKPDLGVSLVISGAGTGKTRTLVYKVKNIIDEGLVKPEHILILTFSTKAAFEIKERVEAYTDVDSKSISSGTFHSFCLRLLRENSSSFIKSYGFNNFPSVLDQEERMRLLKEMIKNDIDQFMGLPVHVVFSLLNGFERIDKLTQLKLKRMGIANRLDDFNKRFIDHKRSKGLIDFSDIISFTIDLLSKNRLIREEIAKRYKYVLVDEFQDTSEENFKLLKLLTEQNRNLFLVGDDWQSIYGFRGSRIEYIINMKKYFPHSEIHKLKINYRSRKEIVNVSNNFIRKNRSRTNKKLISFKGKGGSVIGYFADSFEDEIALIRDILLDEKKLSYDIAILYRNNWQGDYIRMNINDTKVANSGSLNFMTIHSSKGLEFESVIIAGVSDNILPDVSSDIEEERRLFYVALTRAKERLHIICHRTINNDLPIFSKDLGLNGKRREKLY